MATVSVNPGATGSDVVLSANTVFAVESGSIDLSTDAGTTWVTFSSSEKVVFSSGLTVKLRNTRADIAIIDYMAI